MHGVAGCILTGVYLKKGAMEEVVYGMVDAVCQLHSLVDMFGGLWRTAFLKIGPWNDGLCVADQITPNKECVTPNKESAHKVDSREENSATAPAGIQTCNLSITSPAL